jgi:hypothetical protein
MQSAPRRKASARTATIAESRVTPYAITPGMDSMSASQRLSSPRPTTMAIDAGVTDSVDDSSLLHCPPTASYGISGNPERDDKLIAADRKVSAFSAQSQIAGLPS